MLPPDNFPAVQALALNTSVPGLWRFANHDLQKSWRAGSEVPPDTKESRSQAAAKPCVCPLLCLPDLALVAIFGHLDKHSLCAASQTCRAAFSLASKVVSDWACLEHSPDAAEQRQTAY